MGEVNIFTELMTPCDYDNDYMFKMFGDGCVVQELMWEYVGIVRSTERLLIANLQLASLAATWQEQLAATGLQPTSATREICEMRNLLSVASLIVRSALQRHESRGLHYVTDFPQLVESQRLPTVLLGEVSKTGGGAELT